MDWIYSIIDCFCYVIIFIFRDIIFNGTLWKDYVIPITIPFLIWYLTWYYGAEESEKRKEKRELRDNLNFLASIMYINIEKCLCLRKRTLHIIEIENRKSGFWNQYELEIIFSKLIAENFLEAIDITKYSSCIEFDHEFIINLTKIKNIMCLLHNKIEIRNNRIAQKGSLDELIKNIINTQDAIDFDCKENETFVQEVNGVILKCRTLASEINRIARITQLSVKEIKFTPKEENEFKKIEKEYTDYIEQPKEQK